MTLTHRNGVEATTEVNVVYYDGGGNRPTTIAELDAQFSDETQEWRNQFFHPLNLKVRQKQGGLHISLRHFR